jgi:hypothetical protein
MPELLIWTQSQSLHHYFELNERRTVRFGEAAMWVRLWPEASTTPKLLLFLPVTMEDLLAHALSLVDRPPDSGL